MPHQAPIPDSLPGVNVNPPAPVITARSIKALVGSLREGELDLPFVACTCPPGQPCGTFAQVTATKIVVHRP